MIVEAVVSRHVSTIHPMPSERGLRSRNNVRTGHKDDPLQSHFERAIDAICGSQEAAHSVKLGMRSQTPQSAMISYNQLTMNTMLDAMMISQENVEESQSSSSGLIFSRVGISGSLAVYLRNVHQCNLSTMSRGMTTLMPEYNAATLDVSMS